jgi:cytochrome c553
VRKIVACLLAVSCFNLSADGDPVKGQSLTASCVACHGTDGNSPIANQPSIAGQNEKYLFKQLKEFKSGDRNNAIMAPMVSGLSEQDMRDIAAFYASQSVQYKPVADKYIELGQRLYLSGDADRDIPACVACHGIDGNGMSAAGFPALGGQHPEYTKLQLIAFRKGQRDNDANGVMRDIVAKMSDEQIEALAHFLAGLH